MNINLIIRRRKALTSPKRGNIFALILILYVTVVMIAISLTVAVTGVDENKFQLLLIVIQDLIILFIPVLFYCLFTRTRLGEIIPHEKLSLKNIMYVILLTLLFSPLIIVVSSVTSLFYSSYDNNALIFGYIDSLPMWLGITALGIMPAVFEELAFRGVILSNYKSLGLLKAAFISGLFFGLFHMDFFQIPYAVLAGVFFSFLVRYTNSIYASILSHFLINGTQVVQTKLIFLIGGSDEIQRQLEMIKTSDGYGSVITGVFLTIIATPFLIMAFKKFMKYNKNHKLDYELSIPEEKGGEFEIYIENINDKKTKFADIYFWAYVVFAAAMTLAISFLSKLV